jgi:putative transposase
VDVATRNITFRLYPTPKQEQSLSCWLDLHRELYNAALQERRDAWRKCGVSLSYYDQQNQLPAVKAERPDLIPLGSHALQETVRRVDRAFKAFFRRVKQGQKAGFPRFKAKRRFNSFTYPDPAGWNILESKKRKGLLRITNLGTIRMRGKPRVSLAKGEPRTFTIRLKNGKWYATIGVRYPEAALQRNCAYSDRPIGLDAGATNLVASSEGEMVANPKPLARATVKLKKEQRNLSKKKRGSRNRNRARIKVAKLHEKVRNQRKEHAHQLSHAIAYLYSFIAIEDLTLRGMTKSARGSIDNPGKNVKQKAGLNRSILDASIGQLFSLLEYKAAEAGTWVEKVHPHGTSQACSVCGEIVKKHLSRRNHHCTSCGCVLDRDVNAARNILYLGLSQAGMESPGCGGIGLPIPVKHETTPMTLAA